MELDLIDAPAVHVVRVQLRPVRVGQAGMGLHVGAAGHCAQRAQAGRVERWRVALERVTQRSVGLEQVDADPGRSLVLHLMCGHAALLNISTCGLVSSL